MEVGVSDHALLVADLSSSRYDTLQRCAPPARRPRLAIEPVAADALDDFHKEQDEWMSTCLRSVRALVATEQLDGAAAVLSRGFYAFCSSHFGVENRVAPGQDTRVVECRRLVRSTLALTRIVLSEQGRVLLAALRKRYHKLKREERRAWQARCALQIESGSRAFYRWLRCDGAPPTAKISRIGVREGASTEVYEGQAMLDRLADHWEGVYGGRRALDALPPEWSDAYARMAGPELDVREAVTVEELEEALRSLGGGKAPGADGLSAEAWRLASPRTRECMRALLSACLRLARTPACFRSAVLCMIPKDTSKPSWLLDNMRPISLLSVLGKTLEHVILRRLKARILERLSPLQVFVGGDAGGTLCPVACAVDMIDAARKRSEALHMVAWDVRKAYDTVQPDALEHALRRIGASDHLVELVRNMHSDMRACVDTAVGATRSFAVTTGIRQGSVLGPLCSPCGWTRWCGASRRCTPCRGGRMACRHSCTRTIC
jgi:hypothetical protein